MGHHPTRRQARLIGLLPLMVLGVALLAPVATADTEAGMQLTDVDVDEHPQVTVRVSPPAALRGVAVPESGFAVREDGQSRPFKLEAQPETELEMVLVIDTSTSMGIEPMAAIRQAATDFVDQMPAEVALSVVRFDDEPEVVQELTDDHDAVRDAIDGLRSRGATALYDALDISLDQLSDSDAEKAVLLFTDGADNGSTIELVDAVDTIQAAGVPVHIIELVTEVHNREAVEAIAGAGGGEVAVTDDVDEVSALYDELASKLVHRYLLTYDSDATGEVELTVAVDHDGVADEATTRVTLPGPTSDAEPEASAGTPVTPSFWSSTTWLVSGAGLVYVALAIMILAALSPRRRRAQLSGANQSHHQLARGGRTALAGLADRLVGAADDTLRRQGRRGAINSALERAGITLRPGELVVLIACLAVAAFAVGLVLTAWWFGLLLAVLTVFAVKTGVSFMGSRRQNQFLDQLSDTLQVISGGLRAGYGLQQAIDAAAKEAETPTAEELHRLLVEVRLGRDLMDALKAMADRMGSEDFHWVVQAIGIHREVGGDLAELLDTVAGTVRERSRVRRQVKALSAEGRLSAWVLFGLPFFVAGGIALINPLYLAELTSSIIGYAMLGITTALLIVGGLWLRRIVDLEY